MTGVVCEPALAVSEAATPDVIAQHRCHTTDVTLVVGATIGLGLEARSDSLGRAVLRWDMCMDAQSWA